MRRTLICTLALAGASGSLAIGQEPLFPRPVARFGGVRAVPGTVPPGAQFVNAQAPGSVPMPMTGGAGQPGTTPPSTKLDQPREIGPVPGVTESRGAAPGTVTIPYPPGSYPVYPPGDGSYAPYAPGSYLNDAPYCPDGSVGAPSMLERPLFPGLGHRLGSLMRPGRWYISAEYLLWYAHRGQIPALLTTSNAADNGFLGAASTQVLLGNQGFGPSQHSGARFGAGYWFGCDQRWGLDANYFFLAQTSDTYETSSPGSPLLARPFTNGNTGRNFSQIIAYPGVSSGSFQATATSSLWGGDINLRRFLTGSACRRFDLIAGFRYLDLEESLTIRETFARTANSPPGIGVPGSVSGVVTDSFSTENHFYGGQFGMLGELRRGRWYFDGRAKVALGAMFQSATIDGNQSINFANGTTQNVSGGLLALPNANIGTFRQEKFCVIPEATFNIGYHVTPHCRLFVGYNFLYASSVLRPGDQIDTTLDVTRIPNFPVTATPMTNVRPSPTLRTSDYYVQGINFGLQFSW